MNNKSNKCKAKEIIELKREVHTALFCGPPPAEIEDLRIGDSVNNEPLPPETRSFLLAEIYLLRVTLNVIARGNEPKAAVMADDALTAHVDPYFPNTADDALPARIEALERLLADVHTAFLASGWHPDDLARRVAAASRPART